MNRIFFPITVTNDHDSTQTVWINVNLIEYITETTLGVNIVMQNGTIWLVNQSIYELLEGLQG
jgi:uncharacterized protein YlzI (FlbEa/FlbD family)